MIPTAIISFREFLEVFLIIGVFFGISRKLRLRKELEIGIAASVGIAISLGMAVLTYALGGMTRNIFTHENTEILEGYLMIFSGFFIAYVVFSLHNFIQRGRGGTLIKAHESLKKGQFDFSLFMTIVFLVIREGFEIALFTASTALFAEFFQNFVGLILGFGLASFIGLFTYYAYIRLPIGKIFKFTEYMVVLLGAALVQRGFTEIFEYIFHIELSDILRLPLSFLPDGEGVIGHFLKSFVGIDREFSMARLTIMVLYIGIIYFFFFKKNHRILHSHKNKI